MPVSRKRVRAQSANPPQRSEKTSNSPTVNQENQRDSDAVSDSFSDSAVNPNYGGPTVPPASERSPNGGLSSAAVGGALAVRCGAVQPSRCMLNTDKTAKLLGWVKDVEATHAEPFKCASILAARLGATPQPDGSTELGFWVPELDRKQVQEGFIEVLTPLDPVDFAAHDVQTQWHVQRVALEKNGEYLWGVVDGLTPGDKNKVGSFYQIRYQDPESKEWVTHRDHFAASLPYGAFAPAELYDVRKMQSQRQDLEYFAQISKPGPSGEPPRQNAPTNILQVHVRTASERGSIAGLTERFERLAEKIRNNEELSPEDEILASYDSVQLLPIEPTIEHEGEDGFFQIDSDKEGNVNVRLKKPDITNWGYDNVMVGTPAIAPTLLETRRPDELLKLIETLHTFPGSPIKVVFDVVYGHIDNQAVGLVEDRFIAGQGMYGKTVNYRDPVVRAQMLEMQRRKSNYGVDGVRVDGAQDFKYWDESVGTLKYDDDYLKEMSAVPQEIGGHTYYPWMVFEDGRPWPDDDWEQKSTYREVTDQQPHAFQWGPLTFAHNTPMVIPFWLNKAWRAREVAQFGERWITGAANHDTLRRGAQVPTEESIDPRLGKDLMETIAHAYDQEAATLWTYAFMPGVPMEFLQANARAPWAFVRNTDDRYGVKVASEESRFLEWRVDEASFVQPDKFPRLKTLGFQDYASLKTFWRALEQVNTATGDDLDKTAKAMAAFDCPDNIKPLTVPRLKQLARAYMDDLHEYVNVDAHKDKLEQKNTRFGVEARKFRKEHSWLANNFGPGDVFQVKDPSEGAAVFYGVRTSPDRSEQLLFVGNMQGVDTTINIRELDLPGLPKDGWECVFTTPGFGNAQGIDQDITFKNASAVVFRRTLQDA